MQNDELDRLINRGLSSDKFLIVPESLVNKTILRIGKKILFRELLLELIFKAVLVLISIAILAGVFILYHGSSVLSGPIKFLFSNWELLTLLLLLIFITILIDQVGMKLLAHKNETA